MKRSSQPRCSGFTLLEIMVALAIAALIMAVGVPSFVKAARREGLRKGVMDLVEGCSEARTQAILKGTPVDLLIQPQDRRITVAAAELDDAGVWATGEKSVRPDETHVPARHPFARVWPEQVGFLHIWVKFEDSIEASEARIRFYPNGTSDEFTAILVSTEGQYKVSLDPVTGYADSEPFR